MRKGNVADSVEKEAFSIRAPMPQSTSGALK
jgi:hypothetical protein